LSRSQRSTVGSFASRRFARRWSLFESGAGAGAEVEGAEGGCQSLVIAGQTPKASCPGETSLHDQAPQQRVLLIRAQSIAALITRSNRLRSGWTRDYSIHTVSPITRMKKDKPIQTGKVLVTCIVSIPGVGTHSGSGEERADDENAMTSADIVELETLSLSEIRAALPDTGIETAIVRGGFPELYANPDIDLIAFYNSYLATYLERDVRLLTNVGSLRDFERFVRACALRSANLLNKADLARDVGIAPSTASHWLSMLEASGQIVLLEPWFSNRTRSIVKSPKFYFADTGLLCALLNIRSEDALRQSPAIGAIWETFVFAQLRDRERRAGRVNSLFFWRDRTREVDFVVDAGGRMELYEAKWTEVPDTGDTVNLDFVRNVVGKSRVTAGAVISRTPNSFPLCDTFRALPLTELG
jgi:hypothetical protein